MTELAVPDHVLLRRVRDDMVLLDLETDRYYSLTDVGASLIEQLVQDDSLEAATAALLEEFDVDEATLRRDLEVLITELSAAGLLIRASGDT